MSNLTKYAQNIFGSSASAGQLKQFGSLAAGSPANATDPGQAQSLTQWLSGWFTAIIGGADPTVEDWNTFCWVVTYQIAYAWQKGVPEWDSVTTYYTGSLAMSGGRLYVSLIDNNQNQSLTNQGAWQWLAGSGVRAVSTSDVATNADSYIRVNPGGTLVAETLPALSTVSIGQRITIKNVGTTSADQVGILTGAVGDTITDGNPTLNSMDSVTFIAVSTTNWDMI